MSKELKRNWIENLKGWQGLDYVYLQGVPMKKTKNGGEPNLSEDRITKLVAHQIIQSQIPLRGQELSLLRSATRLSYNKLAQKLGLSYGALFNWEKNKKKKLIPLYEVAIRLLCSEELNIEVSSKFSELVGHDYCDRLDVKVTNKEPTDKFIKMKTIYKSTYRGLKKVTVKGTSDD